MIVDIVAICRHPRGWGEERDSEKRSGAVIALAAVPCQGDHGPAKSNAPGVRSTRGQRGWPRLSS